MGAIAIFGAGPALGLSTARRFAADGEDVALIGRLAVPEEALAALATVRARLGDPDTVLYSPGDVSRLPVDVRALDAPTLASWLPLNLLTPVALAHAAVPAMVARGAGAFVAVQGAAVRVEMPPLASSAVAQAGLLTYLRTLDVEVRPAGVRVASLQIGGLIERSAAARLLDEGHFDGVDVGAIPRVDPDVLAETVRGIAHDADRVEFAV